MMTHTRHVVGLIALLLVGLYVVTAYAVVGPTSVADDSGSLTVADFEPTDSGFVQAIKVVEDNDGDTFRSTRSRSRTTPLHRWPMRAILIRSRYIIEICR
jgi:hypothetical protein